jgi:MSHA biogenesis protein MshE
MDTRLNRKVRIGDLLLEKGLIDESQLKLALYEQKRSGKKLGKAITDLGFVTEVKFLAIMSDYFGYPFIDLSRFRLDSILIQKLPETQARRYRALLLSEEPEGMLVGLADPTDLMITFTDAKSKWRLLRVS